MIYFEKFISCKDEKIIVLANGVINAITMECYQDRYFKDYICKISFESLDSQTKLWNYIIAFSSKQFTEFYFENLLLFFEANKDKFEEMTFYLFEKMFNRYIKCNWDDHLSQYNQILKLLTTKPEKINEERLKLNYEF